MNSGPNAGRQTTATANASAEGSTTHGSVHPLFQSLEEGATVFRATANQVADIAVYQFRPLVERLTPTLGTTIGSIVDLPFVRFATGVPGLSWLFAALGQVNRDKVQAEVRKLQLKYPAATPEELAQRVIGEFAVKAAGVGLITNFAPPAAWALALIDLGAVAALQANMIYQIAAIYGFSADDPTRRGEVLVIWSLFTGGSSLVKSGLSLIELIPGLGAAVGITSDAALLYGVGYLASRFYRVKRMHPVMVDY